MQGCASCGRDLPDWAQFCGNCGQASPNAQREAEKRLSESALSPALHPADRIQRSKPGPAITHWLYELHQPQTTSAIIQGSVEYRSGDNHNATTQDAPPPTGLARTNTVSQNTTTTPMVKNGSPIYSPLPIGQAPTRTRPKRNHAAASIWIIIFLVALFIPGSLIGASTTIWAPKLILKEGTTISAGTTIHLQGRNFIPDDSVALTLDDNIPLKYIQSGVQSSVNLVAIQGNGTFEVVIPLTTRLSPGYHSLHASERFSLRSTNLLFKVKPDNVLLAEAPPAVALTPVIPTKADCITTSTRALQFTAASHNSNPANQTLVISNCGTPGSWSATATTLAGTNWLSLQSPTSGNLATGASQRLTVSVEALLTRLGVGTFTGSINVTRGNSYTIIAVTLLVQ